MTPTSSAPLRLNLLEGSVSFSFTPEAAHDLKAALNALVDTLKPPQSAVKPIARSPMEYQYTGDVFLELFCNPNIWPNPFTAKVLITVRDDRIRLSTEAELTRIIEDVSLYLEQN